MKIWAKTKDYSEGKYLVVRRDGTIPSWPHFVLGGDDPCTPAALLAYASEAERRGLDSEYVASIRELAEDFSKRTGGKADSDAGPHRTDHPVVIAIMRRKEELLRIIAEHIALQKKIAALEEEVAGLRVEVEILGPLSSPVN